MDSSAYQHIATFAHVHTDSINNIVVSPNGFYAASVSKDGSVAVFAFLPVGSKRKPVRLIRVYRNLQQQDIASVCVCWKDDCSEIFVGFENGRVWRLCNPTVSFRPSL